jgi:hypothetical protein
MDHVVVFVLGVLGLRRRLEAPKDRSSNWFISGRSERFSGRIDSSSSVENIRIPCALSAKPGLRMNHL